MRVTRIAQTTFNETAAVLGSGWTTNEEWVEEIDALAEFAGRNCYQAWERKNPDTATNVGYINNIIDHGHFSVLEHGSVTFYITGISRALTHELIRHRHLSFSELSQRYVNVEDAQFITPPSLFALLQEENPTITWEESNENFRRDGAAVEIVKAYRSIYDRLRAFLTGKRGMTSLKARKKAREAARAVMPNCTETKIVVTGNLRAWREFVAKRYHEAADEEIKQLAGIILDHLREIAPNSVRDIPEEPYGA